MRGLLPEVPKRPPRNYPHGRRPVSHDPIMGASDFVAVRKTSWRKLSLVSEILLTTLNARYAHASFGLRYLMANLPSSLRERAAMMEFDISQRPIDVAEKILAADPKIVGIGVY